MIRVLAASTVLVSSLAAGAQQSSQPELKVDPSNRTLTVTANESIDAEPDLAILHIGFETPPTDAKSAYAEGARTSNAIVDAIKQAGIPETSIRSESQYLEPDYTVPKSHKFRLAQQWTVRTSPARAAEILDAAINAGANSSGQIDWTVKDEAALEEQALDKAAGRAKENANVLAKGMGVRLGALIYVSNQLSASTIPRPMLRAFAMSPNVAAGPPLAVEPHKVSRQASVYAVFAIE
jgi:uncharacterized protein